MERLFIVLMFSFLLLLGTIATMVLVYLWLVWYVSLHERRNREERSSQGNGIAQKQQGLSVADLERLPTIECVPRGEERSSESEGGANAECAVCLEVFHSGDRCRVIPACSHAFHVECADAWLSKRSVCPICRRSAACDSKVNNGINDSAVAAEIIVVDMSIATTPVDHRG